MEDVFIKSGTSHRTRYSDETMLSIPLINHDYCQNCLYYLGATIWNSLENSVKAAKTCNSFKHKVKDKCSNQLKMKEEDVYIY